MGLEQSKRREAEVGIGRCFGAKNDRLYRWVKNYTTTKARADFWCALKRPDVWARSYWNASWVPLCIGRQNPYSDPNR